MPVLQEIKMPVPTDRTYLKSHEWHKVEGDTITIGITQHAADELTDVTYVSLPKVGDRIDANGRFGEVESVKTTSELYSGVAGTVTAINDELGKNPGLVNSDPFNGGWMVKLKADDSSQAQKLLSAADYDTETGH
jgi:glycine cleavage system H protein